MQGFVQDFPHNVPFGISRTFVEDWSSNTSRGCYIGSPDDSAELDEKMLKLTPPLEVRRRPRKLSDNAYWNAREFENWTLFFSLPVLEGILPLTSRGRSLERIVYTRLPDFLDFHYWTSQVTVLNIGTKLYETPEHRQKDLLLHSSNRGRPFDYHGLPEICTPVFLSDLPLGHDGARMSIFFFRTSTFKELLVPVHFRAHIISRGGEVGYASVLGPFGWGSNPFSCAC